MPRGSRITYNQSLSVEENAKRNGVTVSAIRYYIKTRGIDRRYDAKANIISDIQRYLKKHPEATIREVVKATGHGINTVKRYWAIVHGVEDAEKLRDGSKAVKKKLRELNNFYATHPSCTADLLREEEFYHYVLEPFCGVGTMSEVLIGHGHEVLSYDIVDRGYGEVGDFFTVDFEKRKYDIVSNPPYDECLADIVARCVEICHKKVALLMPLRYLSGQDRYKGIYRKYPPVRVYVYLERINIAQGADFERFNDAGANREIYAWFVWERGHKGDTVLKWIHNDRKRSGLPTVKTAAQKLKEEIDNMVAIEHKNSILLQEHPAYLPEVAKRDIAEPQKTVYDTTRYCCVAFRSKNDLWKEHKVQFGNMNGGYRYQINGVYVPTSEHAYILGLFSNNTGEHKAIQEELLREPSGYNAKRGIRNGHRNLWRADWHDFNREWMLYVVWEKVRQCEDFRQLLMSLPRGTAIVEDVSFKPKDENGADFWGARNPDKKVFGGLVRKYVRSMRLSTKRAMEDAENSLLWDFCCYGQYEGYNIMGKILTYIKQCLHEGIEPEIDYELLRSKDIYIFGKLMDFEKARMKNQSNLND